MGGVRTGVPELKAALIVKVQHQLPVAIPSFNGRNVIDIVLLPQAAGVPEGGKAAFGAHSGAAQHYQFLFHCHSPNSK